ncbi:MAG: ACT domain-containing protein [Thermoanaerobaculia bacterium]
MRSQRISVVPGLWSVVRLAPDEPVPQWAATATGFVSITRTADELSIVCPESLPPAGSRVEPGWALIRLHGPIPFDETGVLASLASPLATAGVAIFAVSTFDTDYILVKASRLAEACEALVSAGHELLADPGGP